MSDCKPCSTPVDTQAKLSADLGDPVADPTAYRSLAGALQYLTFTRPDLTYAVQQVCLHMHDPRESHLAALKRLLRYVRGTVDLGLVLHRSSSAELVVYTDADWAGCPDTRRSTSGYAVFLGGNLVSWSSKRQPVVSRSSAEAEYRAVANGVAEASWLRQLLAELHSPLAKSTLVYCDNVSAVYLSTNPVQHQRTKHVEIDLHSMSRLPPSLLTSSPRDCPPRPSRSFAPASTWLVASCGCGGYLPFVLSSCPVLNTVAPVVQTAGCVGVYVSPCIEVHLDAHV